MSVEEKIIIVVCGISLSLVSNFADTNKVLFHAKLDQLVEKVLACSLINCHKKYMKRCGTSLHCYQ